MFVHSSRNSLRQSIQGSAALFTALLGKHANPFANISAVKVFMRSFTMPVFRMRSELSDLLHSNAKTIS